MSKPNCSNCSLRCGEEFIVWGRGVPSQPDLFIIGEAPGREEHYAKKPFVGRSGELLTKTLTAITEQTGRQFTYWLTNTVMCRPPGNRNPSDDEIANCYGRLVSEIEEAKPKCIVTLGAIPTKVILGDAFTMISKNRGNVYRFRDIPVYPTWHPAYILRNASQFRAFSNDLIRAIDRTVTKYDWKSPRKYTRITDIKQFDMNWFKNSPISFDIETSFSKDPFWGAIVSNGFHHEGKTYIFMDEVFQEIKEKFDPNTHVIVHNGGYELPWWMQKYDIELTNVDDTIVMAHLIDERKTVSRSLKALAKHKLGIHDWEAPVAKYIKGKMHLCPADIHDEYLTYDVETTYELYKILRTTIDKDPDLKRAYDKVIRPAIPFVHKLTHRGFRIDAEYLEELESIYSKKIDGITNDLKELSGIENLNPGSYKQLIEVLYEKFSLPPGDKRSTDDKNILRLLDYLESIEADPEQPEVKFLQGLKEFRSAVKLQGTYISGLLKRAGPDSRIHPYFKLHGTETGRLSSDLHQIPRGSLIRRAFLPEEGMDLIDADYAQLEARVGAHLSNDEVLIEYINSGRDIHKEMASIVFNKLEIQVTPNERQLAKNGFFAVMYFSTPRGFVFNFGRDFPGLTVKLADRIIDTVRMKFQRLYFWSLEIQKQVMEDHYITSLFGRKRRWDLISSENMKDVRKQATNTPIQASASDICLVSGIRLDKELPDILQHLPIHDGLLMSAPKSVDTEEVRCIMKDVPFESPVQFDVEIKRGERWGEYV